MRTLRTIIPTISLIFTLSLVGCGTGEALGEMQTESKLEGSWHEVEGDEEYHFYDNGTVSYTTEVGLEATGKWEVVDPQTIELRFEGLAELAGPRLFDIRFEKDGDLLNLESSSDDTTTFERVESAG